MQGRWPKLKVRDSRTPKTRTQKLSGRLLRNDRCPCGARRRAAVTSLFIRTPIRSQTNRKFYAPVSLLPKNVVYRASAIRTLDHPLEVLVAQHSPSVLCMATFHPMVADRADLVHLRRIDPGRGMGGSTRSRSSRHCSAASISSGAGVGSARAVAPCLPRPTRTRPRRKRPWRSSQPESAGAATCDLEPRSTQRRALIDGQVRQLWGDRPLPIDDHHEGLWSPPAREPSARSAPPVKSHAHPAGEGPL